MALALIAYLHLMSTDADDLATARTSWEALSSVEANDREQRTRRGHRSMAWR